MNRPLTPAQAHAIIACCQIETQRRERGLARQSAHYLNITGIGAETRRFMHQLADVEYAALGVIEGIEGAQDSLQAALDAADYHPLWAASAAGLKRDAAPVALLKLTPDERRVFGGMR